MAKFFEQLGGAPAVAAFTNGDWTDYVEECFEEAGRRKGKCQGYSLQLTGTSGLVGEGGVEGVFEAFRG